MDLRYAIRALRRSPGFAVTIVVTLALGIGATTTMFSVLDQVLLRPLSYPEASQLVVLYQRGTSGRDRLVSYPTLQDWAQDNTAFSGMAWIRGTVHTLDTPTGPARVITAYASSRFFQVMGTSPALGRVFAADEEAAGGAPVVVLSHDVWTRSYSRDPNVVGRTIELDGSPAVVIGVMPQEFAYPAWAEPVSCSGFRGHHL